MIFNFLVVFLDFGLWVKDFKVFDLRFGFLVKNCVDLSPGTQKKQGGANFNNSGVGYLLDLGVTQPGPKG